MVIIALSIPRVMNLEPMFFSSTEKAYAHFEERFNVAVYYARPESGGPKYVWLLTRENEPDRIIRADLYYPKPKHPSALVRKLWVACRMHVSNEVKTNQWRKFLKLRFRKSKATRPSSES